MKFRNLKFYGSLLLTSIRASMSFRGAFLLEAGLLFVNNLIFFVMWIIFFDQYRDIGGWYLRDMVALMAIGSGAWGVKNICFGGMRELGRMIIKGQLDPFMTQPKNLLIHIVGTRSYARGWGHLSSSIVLMYFGGLTDPLTVGLMLLGIVTGGLVFTSAGIIAHSLTFWLGPVESLSKKYCDSLFLFALYPTNIYSGVLQVFMFTLMPAGIIGFLPVELVREFSFARLGLLLVSSMIITVLAFVVFHGGLKRYESGNQIGGVN